MSEKTYFCDEDAVLGDPYDSGVACPHPDPEDGFCLTCGRRMT